MATWHRSLAGKTWLIGPGLVCLSVGIGWYCWHSKAPVVRNTDPRRFVHTFEDGSRLELVSVCNLSKDLYWTPSGKRMGQTDAALQDAALLPMNSERICLRFTPAKGSKFDDKNYFPRIETAGGFSIISSNLPIGSRWECVRSIENPKNEDVVSVPILAAVGQWRVESSTKFSNSKPTANHVLGELVVPLIAGVANVSLLSPDGVKLATSHGSAQKKFYVSFKLPFRKGEKDYSFAAYDANGTPFLGSGWQPDKNQAWFIGDPDKVARIELHTRPIERFSYQDVVVRP